MKKVIVLDMHGPVYRYSEEPGITLVENITPEQAKEGEEIFVGAAKSYGAKHAKYISALCALSSDKEIAKTGSEANLLELQNDFTTNILTGKDSPCGLELNLSAAKYIFGALHKDYTIVVVSSSMIPTSKSILERTLDEYKKNTQSKATNALFDASDLELHKLGISVCNIAEFGSKKDYRAWKKVFENFVEAPYRNAVIEVIIEDDKKKCLAAFDGAKLTFLTNGKDKPSTYHQITPEGPIQVF